MDKNGFLKIADDVRSGGATVETISELDQALTVLKERAARLNLESGFLNGIIAGIEEELFAVNVGFEVSVDLPWLEDMHHVQLGWKRSGGQWRLVVVRVPSIHPVAGRYERLDNADQDPTLVYREEPLLLAPRHARILALQVLPKLVSQLAAATEEAIETIEQAKRRTPQGEALDSEKPRCEIASATVVLQEHY
jgi:hypothetical protein